MRDAKRRTIGSLIGLTLGIGAPLAIAPHAEAAKPQQMMRHYVACKTPAKAPAAKVGSACKYRARDPHTGKPRYAVVTYTKRGTHLVKWQDTGEVDREVRWVKGRARDLI